MIKTNDGRASDKLTFSYADLDRIVDFLFPYFKHSPFTEYLMPAPLYQRLSLEAKNGCYQDESLQELFSDILQKNGVNPPTLRFCRAIPVADQPALCSDIAESHDGLLVFTGPYLHLDQFIAVVAHEAAHVVFDAKVVLTLPLYQKEKAVDVVTLFMGLGRQMIAGYDTFSFGDKKSRIGYLSPMEMAYCQQRIEKLFAN